MNSMEAKRSIDLLATNRRLAEGMVRALTPEQRRIVPEGFNNNLLWHIGHLVVTQQILCYKLSGLPMAVDQAMVEQFRKGTSPNDWTEDPDDEKLFEDLATMVERLREDHQQGIFTTYETYQTSTGYVLASIDDAIAFNNFHEGIHLGYMLAMRRLVA